MNDILKFYKWPILIASLSLVIFSIIVYIAPMAGEDYGLTKFFQNETILQRLAYAIEKSHHQITWWNARLGEQLAIFELSMPRWISIPFYILSFPVFCLCIGFISGAKKKQDIIVISTICAGTMFLIWPGMEVFFWKTANSGYLQPMILTMLVMSAYSDRIFIEKIYNKKFVYLIFIAGCFLSGLSFENVPVAVIVSMLSLCLWERRRGMHYFMPIISIAAGWVTLITAKSTGIRRDYYARAIPSNDDFLSHYYNRFLDVVNCFFDTSSIIFSVSAISLVYLVINGAVRKYHYCLIFCSILVVGSMVASPYSEPRGFLLAWCVMFSFSCYALYHFTCNSGRSSILILLMSISFAFGIYTYKIYSSYSHLLISRERGIINALGSEKCKDGYEIGIINDDHGYRYINNRDEWYFYNMIEKKDYYGCMITNVK
ncbi:DUF6056 family protein [Pantoea sp. Fr+CA_20]|uniref:DUF6056 family protein n=1 Tax=Pantoea TaxID=53335 RepID=UPI0021195186|nr:DUF6056 family protein [Pantoea sp. Fr+CA_20]